MRQFDEASGLYYDKEKSCQNCPDRHFNCWGDCPFDAKRRAARELIKAKQRAYNEEYTFHKAVRAKCYR